MGNLSEKQLFLVLIGVVGLVAIAFGVLAFLDYQKILDKGEEIDKVKGQTRELQAKIIKIPTLSKNVEDLRKRFDDNLDKLPDKEFQSDLLKGIKFQANNAEVELLTYNIKVDQPGMGRRGPAKGWKEINIDLRVQGGFFQIANFITRIEHYQRILSFRDGKFRVSGIGDKRDVLEFTCTVNAFVQSQKMDGVETQGKSWQSVDIPRDSIIDTRLPDPFMMKLTEKPPPEAGGGQQTPTDLDDKEAEKRLEEFRTRLADIKRKYKATEDPRAILELWEKINKDVESVQFKTPKHRNELQKIKEEVKQMEKPVRELYLNYLLKVTTNVIQEMTRSMDQGEFRTVLQLYIDLMKDFKGINIPQMIRNEIAEGGAKFCDALQKLIDRSDPKTVIWGVDEFEAAMKLTIIIDETERILNKARAFREDAKSIEEFNSFEILVSGIIWTPDSGRRIAIVNGKGYLEGENIAITAKDQKPRDVKLDTVDRNKYVRFLYKNLKIRVKLGKKEEQAK